MLILNATKKQNDFILLTRFKFEVSDIMENYTVEKMGLSLTWTVNFIFILDKLCPAYLNANKNYKRLQKLMRSALVPN